MLGTISGQDTTKLLYSPKSVNGSRTYRFLGRVNAKHCLSLETYHDLYKWSTSLIDDFWGEVWDETDVIGYKGNHVVDAAALPPANPPWFADAKLNWAENMLRCRSSAQSALIEASMSFSFRRPFCKHSRVRTAV